MVLLLVFDKLLLVFDTTQSQTHSICSSFSWPPQLICPSQNSSLLLIHIYIRVIKIISNCHGLDISNPKILENHPVKVFSPDALRLFCAWTPAIVMVVRCAVLLERGDDLESFL